MSSDVRTRFSICAASFSSAALTYAFVAVSASACVPKPRRSSLSSSVITMIS